MTDIPFDEMQKTMDIEIDTGQKTAAWNVGLEGEEMEFFGVEDWELDELKEQLGQVIIRGAKGGKHRTVHEKDVTVRAETLRQLIMAHEAYTKKETA